MAPAFYILYREQERRKRVLGWRRTHKDPFDGQWEQITSWVPANPVDQAHRMVRNGEGGGDQFPIIAHES